MRLAFVSNYLNHHQLSLCNELMKQFDDFVFVSIDKVEIQGYQLLMEANFVIDYRTNCEKVYSIISSFDVVIFGSTIQELVNMRMQTNKLTFLYSERFYKRGMWKIINPFTLRKLYHRIIRYKKKEFYALCASAYLPWDLKLLTYPETKCYKWGYFPETKEYNMDILVEHKNPNSILWCSRFLDWKHPDDSIKLANKLKNANFDFHLNIIGSGEMENELLQMVKDYKLESAITFLGSMPQEQVRTWMEKSEIFLFTSDYGEGWGAVMNEAMNSGCAVVASHAAGSVPFLVKDGINGEIYKSGNIDDMYCKVVALLSDIEMMRNIQKNAYKTINEEWRASVAAYRLKKLVEYISVNKEVCYLFNDGPCSPARILKNNWM